MVLACDGIWDCMSNQEVTTFIRKQVANDVSLKDICERLMDRCLADSTNTGGVGCDNMTVEIVAFLHNQTKEQWYAKIRDSVSVTSPMDVPTSINSSQENSTEEPNPKKPRQSELKSESRQYSVDELKDAPDLASALSNSDEDLKSIDAKKDEE
jgi:protein phosphatase 2C family protein 2/3